MKLWHHLNGPHARPFAVLAACIIVLTAVDGGHGQFLSAATAYSTLQTFATISLVTLGLGLTMMIREFDLSVVGMYGMAGCIAVLTGTHYPWLGVWLALAIGLTAGIVQGLLIVRLHLSSVGVTLGGLLVFVGIAFVLTESRSLPYDNLGVALLLNERIGGVFSIRSVIALVFFGGAAAMFAYTRLGRDIVAIGSDRRAAMTTGVKVDTLIIGVFAFSGLCAALSGVLLSYSLASASPAGLSDVIAPAAAGAILGGVSLGGGSGRPFGIAAGALTLAVLRSGLNAVGAPPFVNDITMGAVLLTVAVLDGPYLRATVDLGTSSARRMTGLAMRRSVASSAVVLLLRWSYKLMTRSYCEGGRHDEVSDCCDRCTRLSAPDAHRCERRSERQEDRVSRHFADASIYCHAGQDLHRQGELVRYGSQYCQPAVRRRLAGAASR